VEPVKIIAGTYGPWAHEFLAADSPEGRLLSLGAKTLPAIREALQDRRLHEVRRARLFGILFSIAGEHDPTGTSALPDYESSEGPWELWGGDPASGTISFGGTRQGWNRKIDPVAQERLTQAWLQWMEHVTMRIEP
jgi:hypothetical protein